MSQPLLEGWRYKGDPSPGSTIESWTRTNEEGGSAWLQCIGIVELDADGDLFFPFEGVTHQQFHADPPTEETMWRAWRYV